MTTLPTRNKFRPRKLDRLALDSGPEQYHKNAHMEQPTSECPNNPSTYHPLPLRNPRAAWTRLLKLEPGHTSMGIRCSLVNTNLYDNNRIPYEAISYTWGLYYDDPTEGSIYFEECTIQCNGIKTRVTRSLFDALRKFRRKDAARVLWEDALCINQSDDQEKSEQVTTMRVIYRKAFQVLIWIGNYNPEDVKNVLDIICQTVNRVNDSNDSYVNAKWCIEEDASDAAISIDSYLEMDSAWLDLPTFFPPLELRLVTKLFAARYFRRLWIFQEITLSRRATMYWGPACIRFEWIASFSAIANERLGATFLYLDQGLAGLKNCAYVNFYWNRKTTMISFFGLLSSNWYFLCSNPRDRVFTLLGIPTCDSDPANRRPYVQTDDTMTWYEVNRMVTEKTLLQHNTLPLLSIDYKDHFQQEQASWIPSRDPKLKVMIINSTTTKAHVHTKPSISRSKDCPKPECLSISGISANSIAAIVRGATLKFGPTEVMCTYTRALIAKLRSLDYPDEDIARCITAGRTDMEITTPGTCVTAMRSLYKWWECNVPTNDQYMRLTNQSLEPGLINALIVLRLSITVLQQLSCFQTKEGLLGVGSGPIIEGDVIAIIFGTPLPLILRPEGDHWRRIGICYVARLMEGQAVEKWEKSGEEAMTFHLI